MVLLEPVLNFWYKREMERHTDPSDGRDDAWSVVAPSLTVMTDDAPGREHRLHDVCNGWRWIVRTTARRLPPWAAVSQHTQRGLNAGVCEAIVTDVRALVRLAHGRKRTAVGHQC
jgi:hypothetical protein